MVCTPSAHITMSGLIKMSAHITMSANTSFFIMYALIKGNKLFSKPNEHCLIQGMLDPFESAYRKQHSTETALVRVVNDIRTAMDKKQGTI